MMYQLTEWLDPKEIIRTTKGDINALDWMTKEVERIIAAGNRRAFLKDGNYTSKYKGKYCIMLDNVPIAGFDDMEYDTPRVMSGGKEDIDDEITDEKDF